MNEHVCTLLPNRRRYDRASAMLAQTPLMDLVERDGGFVLYCNLPGATSEEIDLTIHKGVLHVRAEALLDPSPGKIHALEICDVVYDARLRLTAAVDTAKVKAVLSQGVLRVELPFPSENEPARIPVTKG